MSIHLFSGNGGGDSEPQRLLEDLKRTSVERLSAVPGGLYEPIERQLNDALRLGTSVAPRSDLMSVLAMRQRNATFVMRYRELIARGFDDFRGAPAVVRGGLPLGLVDEHELGFHLAGQRLADAITRRYQRPLELLERRLESLADALGVAAGANPVGPLQLTSVFLHTYRDAQVSDTLQPLLFRYYDEELSRYLGELYQRLNSRLAVHGFVAEGRRPAATAPAAAVPAGAAATATRAAPGTAGGEEDQDEVTELRQLVQRWRAANDDGAGGASRADPARAARPRLRAAELSSVATLLQRERHPALERAMAGQESLREALRQCLLEGTRRLGLDPVHTPLGDEEEDAIDLVGLLFESLAGNEALAPEGRQLLARLMVPYARIALGDLRLFMGRDHPARRFVDAVALTCEDFDDASPQRSELLRRASAAVDHVLAGFNEDLAIFELATRELEDLLEQHRRRAEVVERRSVDTVHGRERLLQARLQAAAALAQRVSGVPLSATVFEFMEREWSHHLVQVILRDGFGSPRHAEVIAIADELVALDAAAARCDRGAVVSGVVSLRPHIVECLASAGLGTDACNEWMAALARALAFPDASRVARDLPAVPRLADDSDDTRLAQAMPGGDGGPADPEMLARMEALEPGTWLRLVESDGCECAVKVAWISPLTSRLLLVDRRGVRKLVASPGQLAALCGSGRLSTDADHMPFDEALRQVRHVLAARAA